MSAKVSESVGFSRCFVLSTFSVDVEKDEATEAEAEENLP